MEIGTTEAARRLKITPGRVRQLIAEGWLSARKVGDHWLINPDELRLAGKRTKRGRPKKIKANGKGDK